MMDMQFCWYIILFIDCNNNQNKPHQNLTCLVCSLLLHRIQQLWSIYPFIHTYSVQDWDWITNLIVDEVGPSISRRQEQPI